MLCVERDRERGKIAYCFNYLCFDTCCCFLKKKLSLCDSRARREHQQLEGGETIVFTRQFLLTTHATNTTTQTKTTLFSFSFVSPPRDRSARGADAKRAIRRQEKGSFVCASARAFEREREDTSQNSIVAFRVKNERSLPSNYLSWRFKQ